MAEAVQHHAVLAAVERSKKEVKEKLLQREREAEEAARQRKTANAEADRLAEQRRLLERLLEGINETDDFRGATALDDIDAETLLVCDQDGANPLHLASWRGLKDTMKKILVKKDMDLEWICGQDNRGKTPLHHAAATDSVGDVVDLLVQPGRCDLFAKDDEGRTALDLAQAWGLSEACARILKAGEALKAAKMEQEEGKKKKKAAKKAQELEDEGPDRSAMAGVTAVQDGRMEYAASLASDKLWRFINDCGPKKRSLLHMAAAKGHAELCEAVLAREDFNLVDHVDTEKSTALHLATAGRHIDCIQAIVRSGRFTNVNQRDMSTRTALHLAALRADLECYQAILEHELCEDRTPDGSGKSAPEYAVLRGLEVSLPDAVGEMDL